jgi:hypothetical protein
VLGGTKNVKENETRNGLNHVRKNNPTNVILISVPHVCDLEMNPCVSSEGKAFNRKLLKQMKIFENTILIKVDPDKDLFTKHGLCMTTKGKVLASIKMVTTIKYILH